MKNIISLLLLIITLNFRSCKETVDNDKNYNLHSWTATVYHYKSGEISEGFKEQISFQLINNDKQFKIRYSYPEKHLLTETIFDHIDTITFKNPEHYLESFKHSNYSESAGRWFV